MSRQNLFWLTSHPSLGVFSLLLSFHEKRKERENHFYSVTSYLTISRK